MKNLKLDKRDSHTLLGLSGTHGSNMVMVAGNDDINVLLKYAILDTKTADDLSGYTVCTYNNFDLDDAVNIWRCLKEDKIAKNIFIKFISDNGKGRDDVYITTDSVILVGNSGNDFSYNTLDTIGEWYKYLFDIALKTYAITDGVVFINKLNLAINEDYYKRLFVYLNAMAIYRNNTIIVATDDITALKAFTAFDLEDDDVNAILVTIKGNNTDNCAIFDIARREHRTASQLVACLDAG